MTMKRPPKWYGRPYGQYSQQAWDVAIGKTREILAAWARRSHVGTYGAFVNELGMLDWSEGPYQNHGQQVGKLLGDASVEEWLEDRPLLSALVISQEEGKPGSGFDGLCEELLDLVIGDSQDASLRVWTEEVRRCHDYWSKSGTGSDQ
jgi:hypothetical protein